MLVRSGTVPEAASELYPFGVLRKRGQGTAPVPARRLVVLSRPQLLMVWHLQRLPIAPFLTARMTVYAEAATTPKV